jgi:hypothetical protein
MVSSNSVAIAKARDTLGPAVLRAQFPNDVLHRARYNTHSIRIVKTDQPYRFTTIIDSCG